jgi:hypothetical protein
VRFAALLLLALPAACASDAPDVGEFDSSAGLVTVEVGSDGFVHCGKRRLPLEAFVLEMRQRTRDMPPEERGRFVVHVSADAGPADDEAALRLQQATNRLLDELYIMGVRQVKFL